MAKKKQESNLTKQVLYQVRFEVKDPKKLQKQLQSWLPKGGVPVGVIPYINKKDRKTKKEIGKSAEAYVETFTKEANQRIKKTKINAPKTKVRLDMDMAFSRSDLDKFSKTMGGALTQRMGGIFGSMKGKLLGGLGLGGLGFFELIHQAHDYNQEIVGLKNSFAALSDATGNTNKVLAVSGIFGGGAFKGSLASLGTIKSTMMSLNSAGLVPTAKGFESLTKHVSDMTVATGIGTEAISGMTAEMMANWQYSEKSTKEMLSSMIAMGDGFNMTTGMIEQTMGVVRKTNENMGALFKDGEKGAKALTKSIGMATVALKRMGVSAQTTDQFIENVMNPENFSQNQALFAQLGISYQEQMNMWETADGKMQFMQKMLTNLPRLAQQLSSIRDPFARMDFAKTLGVPLEIVQKLGKAKGSEIQVVMKEYMDKSKGESAAEKKKQNAAAEQERFSDQLHILRMRIMMPMMQWLTGGGYDKFWKIINKAADIAHAFMEYYAKTVDTFSKRLEPALDSFVAGDWGPAIGKLIAGFTFGLAEAVGVAVKDAIANIWSSGPWGKVFTLFAGAGALLKGWSLAKGGVIGFKLDRIIEIMKGNDPGSIIDTMLGRGKPGAGGTGKMGKWGGRLAKAGKFGLYGALAAGATGAMFSSMGEDAQVANDGSMNGVTGPKGIGENGMDMMSGGGAQLGFKGAGMLAGKLGAKTAMKAIPIAGWVVGGMLDAVDGWRSANETLQKTLTYSADETGVLSKAIYLNSEKMEKLTYAEKRKLAEAHAKTGLQMSTSDKISAAAGGAATLGLGTNTITEEIAKSVRDRDLKKNELVEYMRNGVASKAEIEQLKKTMGEEFAGIGKRGTDAIVDRENQNRKDGRSQMMDSMFESYKKQQQQFNEEATKGGEIMAGIMAVQAKGEKGAALRQKWEEGSINNMEDILKIVGNTQEGIKSANEAFASLSKDEKRRMNEMIASHSQAAKTAKKQADALALARAEVEAMYKYEAMHEMLNKMDMNITGLGGNDAQNAMKSAWKSNNGAQKAGVVNQLLGWDDATLQKVLGGDEVAKKAFEQLTRDSRYVSSLGDTFSHNDEISKLLSVIATAKDKQEGLAKQQLKATIDTNVGIDRMNKTLEKPKDSSTNVRVALETMAMFGKGFGLAYKLG